MYRSLRQRTLDEARTAAAVTCDIALTVAIPEPGWLWAAAQRHLLRTGLDAEAIVDTIGEESDPQIEDCLALLLVPEQIAGCDLVTIRLRCSATEP
ncbi:hypothetical protein [Sphingomonas sp. RIT328]|uniref:hypothetical protein n=1 Tax=Sphingomonas sp. RIT328 TaxID=1470591 RepID=UPI000446AACA|nr:hypothetical protein [Sphingomonas sp. RIT328]EZP48669.1 hypothetical protein BW41_03974 [Sphingomonas sp. RIT328]